MNLAAVTLALFLVAGSSSDVIVVSVPAKGAAALALTPSGKADIERNGTVTQIHIEIDKLQPAQKLSPAMNAYVVWAVSPEGSIESVGELGIIDGKGRLDATTKFDQVGILITAEPHFMVDRPSAVIAFSNQAPKAESVRRKVVAVDVGSYDYSQVKPETAAVPGLVAQARAALQIAAIAQADRLVESEYRLANVALGAVEEMQTRAAPADIISSLANESIRRSQRAFIAAREVSARRGIVR
jgi:hypothetical protein